jgi:phosphoesterase RecJ-like protein
LLGLGGILRRLGKSNIALACDDGVPVKYRFLPGVDRVTRSATGPFDLVLAVDCSDERRGGEVFRTAVSSEAGRPLIINIDHHITNTEALARLMKAWGVELDTDIALCLLTGLVTDTLCFRTANVTPQVMQVAAELMEAGADLARITGYTVNRKPYDDIRFWGALLQTVQLDGGVVSVSASADSRRLDGYRSNGDASVVSFLITAWEADMAASFVEADDGQVDVSLRAKPGFDVAGIALELGGGGHPTASGCTVDGPLEQTMGRVLAVMKKARRQQMESHDFRDS